MRTVKQPEIQLNFLSPTLVEQLNPRADLYLLTASIDWDYFEKSFSGYYSEKGRPAHSIRKMVSLLILKSLYNLSDEKLVEEHWIMNPYYQYFSGEIQFQWSQPCASSDLVYFRKRIGKEGVELIFKHSIVVHGKKVLDNHISIDTTVQEKNITYPTDSKLQKKIIDKCVKLAKKEDIKLRRTYKRTAKQLVRDTYNGTHPKRKKKANSAKRKLKTIAGRLVRELERHLPLEHAFLKELELFKKVLVQTRKSKDKIYSLHEADVCCIAKGKAHKKYEYGNKSSVGLGQKSGIILSAISFKSNVYDGNTLEDVISQIKDLLDYYPKNAWVDRGYRGTNRVGETIINHPKPPLKKDSEYEKRKKRKHFRKRAAIEPIIGHLKQDFRVAKNYLKGHIGNEINFMMAAAGFNFKKLITKLKNQVLCLVFKLEYYFRLFFLNQYSEISHLILV